MDKKEKTLLERIFKINSFIINDVSRENVDKISALFRDLENDLQQIINSRKPKKVELVWRNFSNMSEEEIRQEFNNFQKYPDLDSIKAAVKGFLEMKKVSKVKKRETLIKHILETHRRGSFISEIGRK